MSAMQQSQVSAMATVADMSLAQNACLLIARLPPAGLWLMMWPVLCKVRYELLVGLFPLARPVGAGDPVSGAQLAGGATADDWLSLGYAARPAPTTATVREQSQC